MRGRVDDPLVGLVRDEPGDVICRQVIAFHQLRADIGHPFDGKLEDSLAFLVDVVFLCRHGFVGRGVPGTASFHMQMGAAAAVAPEDAVQYAVPFVIRFEQDAAGAVAEDDTGGAVAIVHDTAHFVATDDHHLFKAPAFDVHRAGRQRIDETGTCGAHIETPGILRARTVAYDIGGSRKEHIGRDSSYDDAVDLFRTDAPFAADLPENGNAEIGSCFSDPFQDPSFLDAGTGPDPFVVSVY